MKKTRDNPHIIIPPRDERSSLRSRCPKVLLRCKSGDESADGMEQHITDVAVSPQRGAENGTMGATPWGSIIFATLFLCFFLLSPTYSQEETSPITAEAAFDKSEITIGDKVTYSVTIEMSKGTEIEFPVIDPTLINLGFAIRDFGEDKPVKLSRKKVRKKYWYLLDTYVIGAYTVPPIVIKYTLPPPNEDEGDVKTQEVFLEVKSVIEEGEEPQDIRDIKLPVSIKVSYRKIIIWSIIILLLILVSSVGTFLYFKYRHIIIPPPPPLPPHVIALRDLEKVKGISLSNEKEIKKYYISVSGIIRHYIENRFGFNAPEQTTEEFLGELTETDKLNQNHKHLLRDFLKHCDLVKFAKYGPTREEIDGVYNTGKHFVEETKERIDNK